jgi:hypothetical protein
VHTGVRDRGHPRGDQHRTGDRRSLHIVHIASSSGDDLDQSLALIDSSRAAGMDVTTEVYPYTAASTMLESACSIRGGRRISRSTTRTRDGPRPVSA